MNTSNGHGLMVFESQPCDGHTWPIHHNCYLKLLFYQPAIKEPFSRFGQVHMMEYGENYSRNSLPNVLPVAKQQRGNSE